QVPMSTMQLPGGVKRVLAGMPFIISIASGSGRVAFSRDAPGAVGVMPLHPGMEHDVREHAFLVASHNIGYSFVRIKGLRNILYGGQGMFMDRFVTSGQQGLLILHGYGNVFERRLGPGENILIEPGAFLYKDSSVTMAVESQQLTTGIFGGTSMNLARMTGPGRVGIQSMYVHHTTE
ncbi:MAG: AIM24 family protein, partial [Thermomicrobiales bacterium]